MFVLRQCSDAYLEKSKVSCDVATVLGILATECAALVKSIRNLRPKYCEVLRQLTGIILIFALDTERNLRHVDNFSYWCQVPMNICNGGCTSKVSRHERELKGMRVCQSLSNRKSGLETFHNPLYIEVADPSKLGPRSSYPWSIPRVGHLHLVGLEEYQSDDSLR